MFRYIGIWSLALLALCGPRTVVAAPSSTDARPPVDITYISNSGFLVECDGKSFLIDALYRWGATGYGVASYETRERMEKAEPPFDKVDLVLASHFHADHFDAVAVGTHLLHNPEAKFIGAPQCEAKFKEEFDRYDSIKDRLIIGIPAVGERIEVEHKGIRVEILNLHHGRTRPVENLGFLIHMGDRTFLDIGDTEADASEFKMNGLDQREVDFAFVPYWYLAYARRKAAVKEGISAQHIIPTHIPPKDLKPSFMDELGGWRFATDQIKREWSAIIFADELEKMRFE